MLNLANRERERFDAFFYRISPLTHRSRPDLLYLSYDVRNTVIYEPPNFPNNLAQNSTHLLYI
jgi:hypothetical protein